AQRPARRRRRTGRGDCITHRAAGLPRHRAGSGGGMSAPSLLQLKGVHTHIGAYHILHGVDFEVPAGQVTMLLGRNGAGKTTTLRTIMGLWPTARGSVRFDGQAIGGDGDGKSGGQRSTPEIARLGIAYVPENMGIFGDLTVRENVLLAARNARSVDDIDTN